MLEAHGGNIYRYSTPVIDFSANINPLGVPTLVREAISNSIDSLVYYPDPDYNDLRTSIARYCNVADHNIIVGNGATELIFQLFRAVRPRKVLAPVPLFSEYERAASLAGAAYIYFPLPWKTSFHLPLGKLQEAIRQPEIDILVLCNPNNPTGQLLGIDSLRIIMETAGEAGVTVVVDETFIEFTDDYPQGSILSVCHRFKNLVVLRALTKFFALPGLRLGYAWVGDERTLEGLNEVREPWSVNTLAAAAGRVAFLDEDYISRSRAWIQEERSYMYHNLKRFSDLVVFPPAANFILCKIKRPQTTAGQLRSQLLNDGILIRDASNFVALDQSFIRLAVKSRTDNQYLISCLRKYLD